ncbi:hypothetical protein K1Y38_27305 [Serratia marcescens]|nr:hypothetical protein [Serratia marcescens]
MDKKWEYTCKLLAIKSMLRCILGVLTSDQLCKIKEQLKNNFNETYDELPSQRDEIARVKLTVDEILSTIRE